MNFVYITKSRRSLIGDSIDVSASFNKTNGKDNPSDFRFSFSETIKSKVFRNVEYLVAAYDSDCPNRIWFKEDTEDRGFKLFRGKGKGRFILTPSGLGALVDDPTSFVGDYDLLYDPMIKMWYIDRTEKLN